MFRFTPKKKLFTSLQTTTDLKPFHSTTFNLLKNQQAFHTSSTLMKSKSIEFKLNDIQPDDWYLFMANGTMKELNEKTGKTNKELVHYLLKHKKHLLTNMIENYQTCLPSQSKDPREAIELLIKVLKLLQPVERLSCIKNINADVLKTALKKYNAEPFNLRVDWYAEDTFLSNLKKILNVLPEDGSQHKFIHFLGQNYIKSFSHIPSTCDFVWDFSEEAQAALKGMYLSNAASNTSGNATKDTSVELSEDHHYCRAGC